MSTHADKLAAALRRVHELIPQTIIVVNEAIAAHEARTFADDCREMAERVRAFLVLDGAGFSDDFLDGLADDLDTIADKVQP